MNKRETKSLTGYDAESLLNTFLVKADGLGFTKSKKKVPIVDWVRGLTLGSRLFQMEGHEYQIEMLNCDAPRQVYQKGAQLGLTLVSVLKSMYGLIHSRYPQGVLYLFPTNLDVSDFSKGRFSTLINDNPKEVGSYVTETDSVAIKRVVKSFLYLRGARSTSRIEGVQKTSSQLRSIPVDRVCFDEVDLFEPSMVDLARERLSHSEIKEEAYLSTPSIPDYGVDKLYQESDQRIWMIRCESCNTETCLESEFPDCLLETFAGQVIRACKKCRKEIYPRNGRWVASYPDRSADLVGWQISQLNSLFIEPKAILKAFRDASDGGNMTEFMNSKLGRAYVSAENRLNISDVYSCCGLDAMAMDSLGPCCMGVDVGKLLHVVVGYKPRDKVLEVCYLARVSSFNDLHDIAGRFNVKCCVIDMEPEMRKAREFAEGENYPVFLCDYQDRISAGPQWDEEKKLVRAQRTELCDTTHELFVNPGRLILPRKCDEVDRFAQQCRNIAKVLEEDPETGSREYRYRKLAEDHFRHALNYLYLASQRIGLAHDARGRMRIPDRAEIAFDPFNHLSQPEEPWR